MKIEALAPVMGRHYMYLFVLTEDGQVFYKMIPAVSTPHVLYMTGKWIYIPPPLAEIDP